MGTTTTFSECVSCGTRVYYIDERRDTKGERYMSITEIPKDGAPGNKERHRVFIHANHLQRFAAALAKVVEHITDGK